VINTLVDTELAHIIHVLVLTEKTPPLGTSGDRVLVIVEMYSSGSLCTISSVISHFVDFGPTLEFRGLIYVIFLVRRLDPGAVGCQSDICISKRHRQH
jgi:hypothetical protein